MREKIKDLVEAAPDMTQDHWDDLAELCRRRVAIQAFLRHMLVIAQDRVDSLANMSIGTEEAREQVSRTQGAANALQSFVGAACGAMGDSYEEELEAAAEAKEEMQERPKRTARKTTKTSRRRRT